jgi:uncharacterized protein (DUF2147 family)
MKRALPLAFALAAMLALPAARADDTSPVGLWKNIDDVSGKPKALIRISDNKGMLEGRIEKLYRPADQDQNPKCTRCEGVNKDQPIIGMVFMSGLARSGDEYTGGQILDPDNGKVYKSKLTLVDGGKKLNVRGYIGVPMLGRSQVWVRQE